MLSRIWHGWTSHENSAAYLALLETEILPAIANRQIKGYKGAHLLRRELDWEVEFITILWFDSLDAVREFVGDKYEPAFGPLEARAILARYDERSTYYDMVIEPPSTSDTKG